MSVLAVRLVVTVPTNNAMSGHSSMTYQQLAMSRIRAVQHDVPVVVALMLSLPPTDAHA